MCIHTYAPTDICVYTHISYLLECVNTYTHTYIRAYIRISSLLPAYEWRYICPSISHIDVGYDTDAYELCMCLCLQHTKRFMCVLE